MILLPIFQVLGKAGPRSFKALLKEPMEKNHYLNTKGQKSHAN